MKNIPSLEHQQASVNATAGMQDPAAEIEAMRTKLARVSRLVDVADKANEDQTDIQVALSSSFAEAVAYTEIDRLEEENEAMRAAIVEAHKFALNILRNYECGIEIDLKCEGVLSKLKPFMP